MPKTYTLGEIIGIHYVDDFVPEKTELYQNFPNPFNAVTTIRYTVVETQNFASLPTVTLTMHNILGEKIATLVSGNQPAGQYQVKWDATDFASGVYVVVLKTNSRFCARKIVYLK
jgi:hypothetical protein